MITCKEDMIGCYVPRADKVVFELFMDKCEDFGAVWAGRGLRPRDYGFGEVVVFSGTERFKLSHLTESETKAKGYRRLTINDFKSPRQYAVLHKDRSYSFQSDKPIGDDIVACFDLKHSEKPLSEDFFDKEPRTKAEYVQVTDSIFCLKKDLDQGELYSKNKNKDKYYQINDEQWLVSAYGNKNVYRKLERPVEWWEDLEDFISKSKHASEGNYSLKKGEEFFVNACMTRDQWCDFARILLEQYEE